jgi:hypothetical protein
MTTQKYIDKAVSAANQAIDRGKKCVMVLFPTNQWVYDACTYISRTSGVHYRAANAYSGLKTLPVDTLILVSPKRLDPMGVAFAKNRLRAQRNAEIIEIDKETDDDIFQKAQELAG